MKVTQLQMEVTQLQIKVTQLQIQSTARCVSCTFKPKADVPDLNHHKHHCAPKE
jgi:hypothetical protein